MWLASQPLDAMLDWIVRIDQHPPLYYILLHLWIRLVGDGPTAVRLLSALLSTLTLPAFFFLGRKLLGPAGGLLAALILALSPFHVRFAQEARMYTLLMLNATWTLLALASALSGCSADRSEPQQGGVGQNARVRRTWPGWLAGAIGIAATLLTHNTAIFFPLAVNVFVLDLALRGRGTKVGSQGGTKTPPATCAPLAGFLVPWLLTQLGAFLLWSPWLRPFVAQAAGVDLEFWIPSPTFDAVAAALKTFLSAFLPALGGWTNLIWAGYVGLLVVGGARLRRRPVLLASLAALFFTPLIGELLVSLRRPIFYDRTLIWATIPLYLLLAAGVAGLRRWPVIVAALGLIAAVNGLSLHNYYVNFQKEEWGQAAGYVATRARDEDLLLFNAAWTQIPFDYYFRAYGRPVAEHGAPADLFERGVLEPKMTRDDLPRLRQLIAGRARVWLIYSHNWYTDPDGLIERELGRKFTLLEVRRFVGVEVRLYG